MQRRTCRRRLSSHLAMCVKYPLAGAQIPSLFGRSCYVPKRIVGLLICLLKITPLNGCVESSLKPIEALLTKDYIKLLLLPWKFSLSTIAPLAAVCMRGLENVICSAVEMSPFAKCQLGNANCLSQEHIIRVIKHY